MAKGMNEKSYEEREIVAEEGKGTLISAERVKRCT